MLFKFHLAHGDTISLCAEDQREAIGRLQAMFNKDVVFVTDKDMQARRHADRERMIQIAAEAEALKEAA